MTSATTATHRQLILPLALALAILALGGCDKKPAGFAGHASGCQGE